MFPPCLPDRSTSEVCLRSVEAGDLEGVVDVVKKAGKASKELKSKSIICSLILP